VAPQNLGLDFIEIVPHFDALNRAALKADHVVVVVRFVEDFVPLHPLEEVNFPYDALSKEKVKLPVYGCFVDLERPALESGDEFRRGYRTFMPA
jgi:hypothetical protein